MFCSTNSQHAIVPATTTTKYMQVLGNCSDEDELREAEMVGDRSFRTNKISLQPRLPSDPSSSPSDVCLLTENSTDNEQLYLHMGSVGLYTDICVFYIQLLRVMARWFSGQQCMCESGSCRKILSSSSTLFSTDAASFLAPYM